MGLGPALEENEYAAAGDMTQVDLAERIGVTRQTVIAVEQGAIHHHSRWLSRLPASSECLSRLCSSIRTMCGSEITCRLRTAKTCWLSFGLPCARSSIG